MVALEKASTPQYQLDSEDHISGSWRMQEKTNQKREVTGPNQSLVNLHALLAGLHYL